MGDCRRPVLRAVGQGDAMAMILDFRSRPDARSQVERPAPHDGPQSREGPEPSGAQIIIFPGVRRERHAEAPRPQRRKSRPKRDRLELLD